MDVLKTFSKASNDPSVFLIGEVHNVLINESVRFKFYKELYHYPGFKYYLCEMSYSMAYYINQYLVSGDEFILKVVYGDLKMASGTHETMINHWQKIYDFHKACDHISKVEVVGIDIEQQPLLALRFLNDVLPVGQVPKTIRTMIHELPRAYSLLKDKSYPSLLSYLKELKADMNLKSEVYKEYLSRHYNGFLHVVQNLLKTESIHGYRGNFRNWRQRREPMLYDNFMSIDARAKGGSYFGQLGMNHVYKNAVDAFPSLAMMIENGPNENQKKLVSILMNYEHCLNHDGSKTSLILPYIRCVNKQVKGHVNLYNLSKSTDFEGRMAMYDFTTKMPLKACVGDFVDFIIVVNGANN